ncbi:methyltransferase family protein [Luteipulveratus mongoliensis]|uniref:Isoprenylcysteine carboxyl methyltransferase n=1 Tax=Luteipulveratus mongoliensis TaxID=571913 RepID=A0A0K1JG42_9MICO|nr:isoprenylcysteine carboxylmethyltransferase family protein [Luteipulveratus mongoliensis]AKU15671.1 isoprenylcysteine carboxyl methyltransferase [Luteipulveratus mongoliensis]
MRRPAAVVGSAAFFVLAPGTVAGLVPWTITRWSLGGTWITQLAGGVLIVLGLVPLVSAFVMFVRAGGTPAPVAPTERLVVSGFNRFVRNPMYVGVVAIILGQAVLSASVGAVVWAVVVWAATELFVRTYEEPTLTATFGAGYDAYRRHVRRWLPRLTPWRG